MKDNTYFHLENTEYVLESYETLENADGNGTTHLLPVTTYLQKFNWKIVFQAFSAFKLTK